MVLDEETQQDYTNGKIRLPEKQENLVRALLFTDYRNTGSGGKRQSISPAQKSKHNGPGKKEQIAEIEEMIRESYPLKRHSLPKIDESDLAEDFRYIESQGKPKRLGMVYQKMPDLERDTEKFNTSVENIRGNIRSQTIFHVEQNLEKITGLIMRLDPQLKELERLREYGEKLDDLVYHQGPGALPKGLTARILSKIRESIKDRLTILNPLKYFMETKNEFYREIATAFYYSKQHPKRR